MEEPHLTALAEAVVHHLTSRQQRLALAESCTGGWVAKVITDIPGSSAIFDRGFVTYSNAAKSELLGVDPALIAHHGAVSEAVVAAMVRGTLQRSAAQQAAAVSGVAGPGGGTPEKPVGTVWIGWGDRHTLRTQCYHFSGGREAVRQQAVVALLRGLRVRG